MMDVTVIRAKGAAALVEWCENETAHRTIVPAADVMAKAGSFRVAGAALNQGIPYGVPWEELLGDHLITVEGIARSLRNAGVWTVADYEKRPDLVAAAVADCFSMVYADVARAAKLYKSMEA